jgi:hypothetical protein
MSASAGGSPDNEAMISRIGPATLEVLSTTLKDEILETLSVFPSCRREVGVGLEGMLDKGLARLRRGQSKYR